MLDIGLIKSRIAARAEDFLRELFGERLHRAGPQSWRVGKKDSLALNVIDGELVYYDHESGQGGDCIALWARERGGDNASPMKACAAWAGVADNGTRPQPSTKHVTKPVDRGAPLDTRPPIWPALDGKHDALWLSGIARLEHDPEARKVIVEWRGWPEVCVRVLARAGLLSAPVFDLWPSVIQPQSCAAFRVLHPEQTTESDGANFWAWRPAQLHVRFHREAVKRDGSPLSWIYAPTKKALGIEDGGNAPLVIARNGRDPEQPGYGARCDCAIVCAGEWDALSVLLASGWIDENGTLALPPGLAIVGIRGEGRGGTDAYLRHYQHWRPCSAILLADADKTGATWFESGDGRPCFAAQIEHRGASVLRFTPSGHKDVGDFYRAGNFGRTQIEAMLNRAGFPLSKGGAQ